MTWLTKNFPWFAAWTRWTLEHTTPVGRVLVLVGLFCSTDLLSLGSPRMLVAWIVLTTMLISFIVGWCLRPQAEYQFVAPRHVTRQEPFTVKLVLQPVSSKWSPHWVCTLTDLPWGWLVLAETPVMQTVERGAGGELRWRLVAPRRGWHRCCQAEITHYCPLGIFRYRRVLQHSWKILVEPRCRPLKDLPLSSVTNNQQPHVTPRSLAGLSFEYLGNREYQPTSTNRRFDFASWARLGRPIVREYQDEVELSLGVVIVWPAAMSELLAEQAEDLHQVSEGIVELVMAVVASAASRQLRPSWIYAPDGSLCQLPRADLAVAVSKGYLATVQLPDAGGQPSTDVPTTSAANRVAPRWQHLTPVDEVWMIAPWHPSQHAAAEPLQLPWSCTIRRLYVTTTREDSRLAPYSYLVDCAAISEGQVSIR